MKIFTGKENKHFKFVAVFVSNRLKFKVCTEHTEGVFLYYRRNGLLETKLYNARDLLVREDRFFVAGKDVICYLHG